MSRFAALKHRNYRLLWIGQLVSWTGSLMQAAAVLWHVSLLAPPEAKGLSLGVVGLVRVLPVILFSILGGVVADALNRRQLMLVTQTAMLGFAAVLGYLTWSGQVTLPAIYLLTALGAAASAFDGPARMALFPSLVPPEALPSAISLNTIMFQAASVIGPALGGIAIAAFGVSWVYVLNALSFVAALAALLLMRGPEAVGRARPEAGKGESQISWGAAREGFRFVFSRPVLWGSMLLDFVATFFSSATALLPLFAQDVLRIGAKGYGWLYAAPAIGAVITSAIMVHAVEKVDRRGRVLFLAVFGYGLATVGFGVSRQAILSFVFLALTGAADTVSMVIRNIIRQIETPDALRGRMTGVNMIFFMGGPQLGELEAGLVAQAFGGPVSVVSGGILCLLASAWIAARTPALRRYRAERPAGVGQVA